MNRRHESMGKEQCRQTQISQEGAWEEARGLSTVSKGTSPV